MYYISEIEKLYPNWFDHDSSLAREDQKWIWENLQFPLEDENKLNNLESKKEGGEENGKNNYDSRFN